MCPFPLPSPFLFSFFLFFFLHLHTFIPVHDTITFLFLGALHSHIHTHTHTPQPTEWELELDFAFSLGGKDRLAFYFYSFSSCYYASHGTQETTEEKGFSLRMDPWMGGKRGQKSFTTIQRALQEWGRTGTSTDCTYPACFVRYLSTTFSTKCWMNMFPESYQRDTRMHTISIHFCIPS